MIDVENFSELLTHPDISIKMNDSVMMPYCYQPAFSTKKHASDLPLIINLHAMRANKTAPKARYEEWNLLSPIDCYGYKEEGSYWAYGYPNFPLLDLIVKQVEWYREKRFFNGDIYISGSSSSGIACVNLANKLKAKAVYLNVPVLSSDTIKSLSESLTDRYCQIFGDSNASNQAIDFLYKGMETRFHIVDQRFGFKDFVTLNSMKFVSRCLELGINVHYEILPTAGHSINHSFSHIVKQFSKYPINGKILSTGFPGIVEEDGMLLEDLGNFEISS